VICRFCKSTISDDALKCGQCCEWLIATPGSANSTPTADDRRELEERRVTEGVQARVERELLRRYSWVGLVVAALTGGTITLLVKASVDDALKSTRMNVAAAEALQARSSKSLDALDTALSRMKTLEDKQRELTTQALEAQKTLRELQTMDATLRHDQYLSAADVLKITEKLDERINVLNTDLHGLAQAHGATMNQPAHTAPTTPSGPSIKIALERATKRQYPISISRLPRSEQLVAVLTEQGYSASIYDEPGVAKGTIDRPEDDEAVWIGRDVPYQVAIDTLRTAIQYMPLLQYFYINGDRDRNLEATSKEIYFGGLTATAREWGTRPFTRQEISELLSRSTTQQEFHARIRSGYRALPSNTSP